jgi:hypothetical protein
MKNRKEIFEVRGKRVENKDNTRNPKLPQIYDISVDFAVRFVTLLENGWLQSNWKKEKKNQKNII